MRGLTAIFGALWLAAAPAQAASCAEGLLMLEKTLRKADLDDDERINAEDMMFQAKVEYDRGNPTACKLILGGIIQYYLLREAPKPSR